MAEEEVMAGVRNRFGRSYPNRRRRGPLQLNGPVCADALYGIAPAAAKNAT